ncbi:hypothetical protein K458DRAFT_67243 [Lentithecium fluviatile CBS 122367]|uniref:Uncharacterized protein n=1 Tax=Lentithecium fluviatile CBS 122367 TaxID=1168545 RepID=A0A6G1JLR4_9PLEO|nr:hypothetical protein K458DRAFT_67243 [Lentithecium fluviatile CBS 122367]
MWTDGAIPVYEMCLLRPNSLLVCAATGQRRRPAYGARAGRRVPRRLCPAVKVRIKEKKRLWSQAARNWLTGRPHRRSPAPAHIAHIVQSTVGLKRCLARCGDDVAEGKYELLTVGKRSKQKQKQKQTTPQPHSVSPFLRLLQYLRHCQLLPSTQHSHRPSSQCRRLPDKTSPECPAKRTQLFPSITLFRPCRHFVFFVATAQPDLR